MCDTSLQHSRSEARRNTAATLEERKAQSEDIQSMYLTLEAFLEVASGAGDPMKCSTSQGLRIDLLLVVKTKTLPQPVARC
jgi:hypothetical protein